METETIDRLFLELSQFTRATTGKELALANQLAEAKAEIEQLREALAFYAEWGIDAPAVDAIIEEDRGDKARAALNIVLGEEE